jgi:hypothetical protein
MGTGAALLLPVGARCTRRPAAIAPVEMEQHHAVRNSPLMEIINQTA